MVVPHPTWLVGRGWGRIGSILRPVSSLCPAPSTAAGLGAGSGEGLRFAADFGDAFVVKRAVDLPAAQQDVQPLQLLLRAQSLAHCADLLIKPSTN
jgi:hypothetical protein